MEGGVWKRFLGEKVIFEKAAISDTDRGKEMNFFLCFWRTSSCGKGLK